MFGKDAWYKALDAAHVFSSAGFDGVCFQAKKETTNSLGLTYISSANVPANVPVIVHININILAKKRRRVKRQKSILIAKSGEFRG